MRECPACGASLWDPSPVCPLCGADVGEPGPAPAPERAELPAGDASSGALALIEAGEAAKAVELLRDAESQSGGLATPELLAMGSALADLGMAEEAERAHYAALRLAPRDPEVRMSLALLARARGDRVAARDHLVMASRIDPGDEQISAALDELREEFRLAESARSQLTASARRQATRDSDDAIATAERAFLLNPESADSLDLLARLCESQGRLEDAYHWSLRLVECSPEDQRAMALCEGIRQRHELRQDSWQSAIALIESGTPGHLRVAIETLDDALAIDPKQADLHRLRAVALDRLGDRSGAIASYRAALAVDPDDSASRDGLDGALQANEAAERLATEKPALEKAKRMERTRAIWRRRGALRGKPKGDVV